QAPVNRVAETDLGLTTQFRFHVGERAVQIERDAQSHRSRDYRRHSIGPPIHDRRLRARYNGAPRRSISHRSCACRSPARLAPMGLDESPKSVTPCTTNVGPWTRTPIARLL